MPLVARDSRSFTGSPITPRLLMAFQNFCMDPNEGSGWFRSMRGTAPLELIAANPLAYVLAAVIAHRAQYSTTFNRHRLQPGEAFLGDFKKYGMTEQNYRTAKRQLEEWGFATFRPTGKGTIAKLSDSRLFAIFRIDTNGQTNIQVTDSQRTANGQLTTTKNIRTEEHKKGEAPANGSPVRLTAAERISAEKQIEQYEAELKRIRDNTSHDAWGPKYTEKDRARIAVLNSDRQRLRGMVKL